MLKFNFGMFVLRAGLFLVESFHRKHKGLAATGKAKLHPGIVCWHLCHESGAPNDA